jgi:hypothetical protein
VVVHIQYCHRHGGLLGCLAFQSILGSRCHFFVIFSHGVVSSRLRTPGSSCSHSIPARCWNIFELRLPALRSLSACSWPRDHAFLHCFCGYYLLAHIVATWWSRSFRSICPCTYTWYWMIGCRCYDRASMLCSGSSLFR